MSEPFDRLSAALQYQLVNSLGFRELRLVQQLAIPTILGGKNCVVLAPTAGGKTEAAFFPLLSKMDTEDWRPVSVIYVAPLKALLNNQEERLSRYAALVGRRAFKWHGDVRAPAKKAFTADPADILLTTPESLEVMLMSPAVPAHRLFQSLQAVVIDEVHAFVADDRGGHLASLLERLSRYCGRDVQRIGLSATVGNPEDILTWAQGSSARAAELVQPPKAANPPELALDYVGSLENAALVAARLHPGKKRLIFVDSRRGVEAVGRRLRELEVDAYVIHSSLALSERQQAEEAFAQGQNCAIVTTSALELGLDVGDLDHVLQVDSPATVASFLQRMGRTGRRPGAVANCTFLATEEAGLVQAAALLRLRAAGFVESVRPSHWAMHLLAHQVIALALQEKGISINDWWSWVSRASPFAEVSETDRRELVEHLLAEAILFRDGASLGLGPRGEQLYGFRNFSELYAVFSTPAVMSVMWGTSEVGTLESHFVESTELSRLSFTLGARVWQAVNVDWDNATVHVQPAPNGAHAAWLGRPSMLSEELCQAIRQVVTSDDEDAAWSQRARDIVRRIRSENAFLRDEAAPVVPWAGQFRWWNHAGGRANYLLARLLQGMLGGQVTSSNFSLGFKSEAGTSEVAIRQAIQTLAAAGRPNAQDALDAASAYEGGRLSKFEPCLPPGHLTRFWAGRLVDVPGAQRAVARARSG